MRRWLAWMHENKIKDIQNRTGKDVFDSNSHYWINLKPDDPSMENGMKPAFHIWEYD